MQRKNIFAADKMKLRVLIFVFTSLCFLVCLVACNTDHTPKPNAYSRIHFPERRGLQTYEDPACPYIFEAPDYYVIQRKTKFFKEDVAGRCWLNLECSDLNATIYLSYKQLDEKQTLKRLVEEAYSLTFKHTQKADYIQPQEIDNGIGGQGLIYYVGGDAASNIQFFITDTVHHFVRGALYFYAHPNADSLKPAIDFMVEDVKGILGSWRWK
ncbi:MAG: hypothetical protein H7X71_05855 [Chitinophagales bacterium]|nr:hypothetical protein [Chitinophagales bacterium]